MRGGSIVVSAGRQLGLLVGGCLLVSWRGRGDGARLPHRLVGGARTPAIPAFLAGESRDRSRSASPWLVTAVVPSPRFVRSSTSPTLLPVWLAIRGDGVLPSGGEPPRQVLRCRVACGTASVVIVVVAFVSSVARVLIVPVVAAIAVVVVAVADIVVARALPLL